MFCSGNKTILNSASFSGLSAYWDDYTVNSDLLKTFVVLSELQSYTKTAQKINVSQSTISKRIDDLERELDTELVERNKKYIKLTPRGAAFLQYAKEILRIEQNAIETLKAAESVCDCINIGSVTSLLLSRVSDCLVSFQKSCPGVSLHIYDGCSDEMLNLLYDNRIDFCFSFFPFRDNNYHCREFAKDEVILVTSPKNFNYPDGISAEELRLLPIIYDELTRLADPAWFDYIYSGKGRTLLYLDSGFLSGSFLASGIGYGFVLKRQAQDAIRQGKLVEIKIAEREKLEIQSYVVYRNTETEYKRVFIQFLESNDSANDFY